MVLTRTKTVATLAKSSDEDMEERLIRVERSKEGDGSDEGRQRQAEKSCGRMRGEGTTRILKSRKM
jgi:hypothetical protein